MNEVKLHETMDAKVWTDEFLRINPEAKTGLDFGTMVGWFANAIMVGFDHANYKKQAEIKSLKSRADRYEEALKKIMKHQEIFVGAIPANMSVTWVIAKEALEGKEREGDK